MTGVLLLDRACQGSPLEKVTFDQSPVGSKEVNYPSIWRKGNKQVLKSWDRSMHGMFKKQLGGMYLAWCKQGRVSGDEIRDKARVRWWGRARWCLNYHLGPVKTLNFIWSVTEGPWKVLLMKVTWFMLLKYHYGCFMKNRW